MIKAILADPSHDSQNPLVLTLVPSCNTTTVPILDYFYTCNTMAYSSHVKHTIALGTPLKAYIKSTQIQEIPLPPKVQVTG